MALSAAANRLKRLMEDLPLPDERVAEAERLIKECTESDLANLGLGPPPRPSVPRGLLHDSAKDGKPVSPQQRLNTIQHVINSLQYNHTPGYYYNVSKSRPFSRIMDTAREALRAALPIKCLEAVFLGALLTAGWVELDRLPLAFKSTVQGQTYRHIVLVVFHGPSRKWGALGLSRRPELMDKDLVYDSLADLVTDYKQSYERWWHTLVRVYVGLPLEHDTYYAGPVCWRYLTLSLTGRKSWMTHRASLDKFAAQARRLAAKFRAMGGKPTTNGSIGGPEANQAAQQQQQGAAGAAVGAAGGPPGGAAGAAERGGGHGAAPAAAVRYAKSVSPARRRPHPAATPLPPPVPRRPITPSRARAAATATSQVRTLVTTTNTAVAGGNKAPGTAPVPVRPSGGKVSGGSGGHAAAATHSAAAPATTATMTALPAAVCATPGRSAEPGSEVEAGGPPVVDPTSRSPCSDGTCQEGQNAGEGPRASAVEPAESADIVPSTELSASGFLSPRDVGKEGRVGAGAQLLLSGLGPDRPESGRRSHRPRRSSDPGSVLSSLTGLAASAAVLHGQEDGTGGRRGAREQVRRLRQEEEGDIVDEEDDMSEESSEEEYISEESEIETED